MCLGGGGGGGSGPKEVGWKGEEEPTTQPNRTDLSIDTTKKVDPNQKEASGWQRASSSGMGEGKQSGRYG